VYRGVLTGRDRGTARGRRHRPPSRRFGLDKLFNACNEEARLWFEFFLMNRNAGA